MGECAKYDSGGVYESPDGRCYCILGTYHARRGARLTHGIIVSLRPDKTVISSHAFELGSRYHQGLFNASSQWRAGGDVFKIPL